VTLSDCAEATDICDDGWFGLNAPPIGEPVAPLGSRVIDDRRIEFSSLPIFQGAMNPNRRTDLEETAARSRTFGGYTWLGVVDFMSP